MAKRKTRQTFLKVQREQALRERRLRKDERREAARLAKTHVPPSADDSGDELPDATDA